MSSALDAWQAMVDGGNEWAAGFDDYWREAREDRPYTVEDRMNHERLTGRRPLRTGAPLSEWPDQQWRPSCEDGGCVHGENSTPALLSELLGPDILRGLTEIG